MSLLPKPTSASLKTRVGLFKMTSNRGSTTPSFSHFLSVVALIPTRAQKRRRVIADSN